MSKLRPNALKAAEILFGMKSGYVLDYSNASFAAFFNFFDVNIESEEFGGPALSKANRLRKFLSSASDKLVGKVLVEILEAMPPSIKEAHPNELSSLESEASRLLGGEISSKVEDFSIPTLPRLAFAGWDQNVLNVLNHRIFEVEALLKINAWLSAIILTGSILEGVLLNLAQKHPKLYNSAKASPKGKDGKSKLFSEWNLGALIDVAREVGHIREDASKFSHYLKEFRNYVHVNQQIKANFSPDRVTALLCIITLKTSLDRFILLDERQRRVPSAPSSKS